MPQQSGWGALGDVLAGGIDRDGAFEEGRLRTAQTETAIGAARRHMLENVAREAEAKARKETERVLAESGIPAHRVLGNVMAAGYGNFQQGTEGLLNIQEYGNRDTLASDAPNATRVRAGDAVQGKVQSPFDAIGPGGYVDLRADDPAVLNTPLGESMIDENDATIGATGALENLRNVQARDPDYSTVSGGGTAGGPGKPPAGYVANPNFDPSKPVGEGNYAYNDARAPVMGAREAVFFNRIIGGAQNAQQTIANIVKLPVGASAGLLGIGSKPGQSMWQASVDTLRNQVASQDVQTYNTMIAGLDANLAQIEGHGLATSDSFRGQYDRLALREGDSELTRLRKLAEMAQTIESGLQPYLHNPRIPPEQRKYVASVVAQVRQSIPFTHDDIAALEVAPGTATLQSLIEAKGLDKPQPARPGQAPTAPAVSAPAPSGNIPTFATEAEAEAAGLAPGTRVIIGGVSGTWQ